MSEKGSRLITVLFRLFLVVGILAVHLFSAAPTVEAEVGPAQFADIQSISTGKAGVLHPAGFAFLPAVNGFILWGDTVELTQARLLANYEQPGGSVNLPLVAGSLNAAFDPRSASLFFLDSSSARLTQVKLNKRGYPDTDVGAALNIDVRA